MHSAAVVVGVGESPYYKRAGATESEFQLACIAIQNAVADAGLTMRDIDGVVAYMERNEPVRLSAALGMGDLAFTAQTFGGGGNGAGAAVTLADAAISAGYAQCVVAFRALAQGQFARYGQSGRARRSRGAGAFTVPYGIQTPAQICAMQTQRFMFDHGVTQDSLAEVVLASYAHAQRNARAVRYGTPLTRDGTASRWIAQPLHLDCCPGTTARPPSSSRPPASATSARPSRSSQSTQTSTTMASPRSAGNFPTAHHRQAGRQLWQRGCGQASVAQFYENFTWRADGDQRDGVLRAGPDQRHVADGNLRGPTGLPINTAAATSMKTYIHGFGSVVEAVRQVPESTCRVADVELSLSVSGQATPGSAVLFGKA